MPVAEASTTTFERDVLHSEIPTVVDFYADWCMPCRQVSPAVEALARKWEGKVRFVKIDIDANPEIARAYRISTIPAVLLFREGRPQAWSVGAKPSYLLEKELGLTDGAPEGNGLWGSLRRWLGGG